MTAALEGGEWSAARPGRTLPPGKTRYPFYRRLGGRQGRSGRVEKSRPHRNSISDRPAHSQSLYRLSYRAQKIVLVKFNTSSCNGSFGHEKGGGGRNYHKAQGDVDTERNGVKIASLLVL